MRSFLLVKTTPGLEREVLERFKVLPEVRDIHLITGKFDLLVALESPETDLDPRAKITELVFEQVRKSGGIVDTRTIIPISTETKPRPPADRPHTHAFVFIQTQSGREKEVLRRLLENPEITSAHLLFGKADILAEIYAEKSFVHPPPQHIATLVETKIAKLNGVRDTDTYVPLESIRKQ